MSKETPYFKFNAIEYLAGTISKCTFEEQGFFLLVCSLWWKNGGPIKNDAKLRVTAHLDAASLQGVLDVLIGCEILCVNDGYLSVKFLEEQMTEREEYLQQCRDNGVKSWEGRRGLIEAQKGGYKVPRGSNSNSNSNSNSKIKSKSDANSGSSVKVLKDLLEMINTKHNRDFSNDVTWIQKTRGDLGRLQSQGITEARMITTIEWYANNEFFAEIQSGKDLCTHFTRIESAMQKESKKAKDDEDPWEHMFKLQEEGKK